MSELPRTVQLSPQIVALAGALHDALERDSDYDDPDILLGRAWALAGEITQLWDEAGDKQRAHGDDMRESGPAWGWHYYGHTPNSLDITCRWCRERFLPSLVEDGEA